MSRLRNQRLGPAVFIEPQALPQDLRDPKLNLLRELNTIPRESIGTVFSVTDGFKNLAQSTNHQYNFKNANYQQYLPVSGAQSNWRVHNFAPKADKLVTNQIGPALINGIKNRALIAESENYMAKYVLANQALRRDDVFSAEYILGRPLSDEEKSNRSIGAAMDMRRIDPRLGALAVNVTNPVTVDMQKSMAKLQEARQEAIYKFVGDFFNNRPVIDMGLDEKQKELFVQSISTKLMQVNVTNETQLSSTHIQQIIESAVPRNLQVNFDSAQLNAGIRELAVEFKGFTHDLDLRLRAIQQQGLPPDFMKQLSKAFADAVGQLPKHTRRIDPTQLANATVAAVNNQPAPPPPPTGDKNDEVVNAVNRLGKELGKFIKEAPNVNAQVLSQFIQETKANKVLTKDDIKEVTAEIFAKIPAPVVINDNRQQQQINNYDQSQQQINNYDQRQLNIVNNFNDLRKLQIVNNFDNWVLNNSVNKIEQLKFKALPEEAKQLALVQDNLIAEIQNGLTADNPNLRRFMILLKTYCKQYKNILSQGENWNDFLAGLHFAVFRDGQGPAFLQPNKRGEIELSLPHPDILINMGRNPNITFDQHLLTSGVAQIEQGDPAIEYNNDIKMIDDAEYVLPLASDVNSYHQPQPQLALPAASVPGQNNKLPPANQSSALYSTVVPGYSIISDPNNQLFSGYKQQSASAAPSSQQLQLLPGDAEQKSMQFANMAIPSALTDVEQKHQLMTDDGNQRPIPLPLPTDIPSDEYTEAILAGDKRKRKQQKSKNKNKKAAIPGQGVFPNRRHVKLRYGRGVGMNSRGHVTGNLRDDIPFGMFGIDQNKLTKDNVLSVSRLASRSKIHDFPNTIVSPQLKRAIIDLSESAVGWGEATQGLHKLEVEFLKKLVKRSKVEISVPTTNIQSDFKGLTQSLTPNELKMKLMINLGEINSSNDSAALMLETKQVLKRLLQKQLLSNDQVEQISSAYGLA